MNGLDRALASLKLVVLMNESLDEVIVFRQDIKKLVEPVVMDAHETFKGALELRQSACPFKCCLNDKGVLEIVVANWLTRSL